jgi:hypothetical protein
MSKKLDATGMGSMNAMKRIKKVPHLPSIYHTEVLCKPGRSDESEPTNNIGIK